MHVHVHVVHVHVHVPHVHVCVCVCMYCIMCAVPPVVRPPTTHCVCLKYLMLRYPPDTVSTDVMAPGAVGVTAGWSASV